jgi:hypothetical protein
LTFMLLSLLAAEPDVIVAADGSGRWRSVQEAPAAAPETATADRPWTILVRPGTYRERVRIGRRKRALRLLGEDAGRTTITAGGYADQPGPDGQPIGPFGTATVHVEAADFTAENLTFENSAGAVGQALALRVDGDRAGLLALQRQYGFVGVKCDGGTRSLVMVRAPGGAPSEVASVPLAQATVWLRLTCDFRDLADRATFAYSLDGRQWTPLGEPLRMAYTLPHFMGYRCGLFHFATKAPGGHADFDYLRLDEQPTAAP